MTPLRVLRHRLLGLFLSSRREQDLAEEVQAHLDLLTEDNRRRGMSPNAARAAARRQFGGVEQIKERYRRESVLAWLDDTWRDLRAAARLLVKHTRFTAVSLERWLEADPRDFVSCCTENWPIGWAATE
jgi:hypothetical protein